MALKREIPHDIKDWVIHRECNGRPTLEVPPKNPDPPVDSARTCTQVSPCTAVSLGFCRPLCACWPDREIPTNPTKRLKNKLWNQQLFGGRCYITNQAPEKTVETHVPGVMMFAFPNLTSAPMVGRKEFRLVQVYDRATEATKNRDVVSF